MNSGHHAQARAPAEAAGLMAGPRHRAAPGRRGRIIVPATE